MIFQQELLQKIQIFLQTFFCNRINATFKSSMFPNSLKLGDVTPLHKKDRKDLKENYIPVSILPTLSIFFERLMFVQISASFDSFSQNTNADFGKVIAFNTVF